MALAPETKLTFNVPDAGHVSALWQRPTTVRAALVLAHGAGAGMRHAFMEALASALNAREIAVLRYQFPYVERASRRPDPQPVLVATVRAAVDEARQRAEGLPLFAGGKSMGGRMTTLAASERALPDVRGILLVGFPLHAMGAPPGITRAAHLAQVEAPMLFLQGTRDTLANLGLMRGVVDGLGSRATLYVVDGADHSFHVPKRSGRDDSQVLDELAGTTATWIESLVAVSR